MTVNAAVDVQAPCPPRVLRPRARPSTETTRRLLVIGTGPRAVKLVRLLMEMRLGKVVACADAWPQTQVATYLPDLPVVAGPPDLRSFILEQAIDEVFVALPLRSCFDEWQRAEVIGRELGVPVHFDFDLADAPYTKLARSSKQTLLTCHVHPASRPVAAALKRTVDIVGASAALALSSPVLITAALLIMATSRGPIFFTQPRVGRHRRVFKMLKFRTMVANAEALRPAIAASNTAKGIMFKIAHDPRVTRVGRWLRRTSIDELPQLINVLMGDMSLVGPRPIPTWVFDQAEEPHFHRRFSVMPGMTGLWQVNGRQQHYTMMIRHDLDYVDHWSHTLDLTILCRTVPTVLTGRGAE